MYININTLIAVYINVSWKTTISYNEFLNYQSFLQLSFLNNGEQLKVLLKENLPEPYNKQIHYIFDNENKKISCPPNIGVKESYDFLKQTMNEETFNKFSDLTHQYFDCRYPQKEI